MSKPVISAIVSTYNSAKFFKNKIEDLLNQTLADKMEIIIVNSGSQENEDELVQEYLDYPNIHYIKTVERESIYKAWNRGIKIAKGEFITNANTDDRLKKDALELMVNILRNNPSVFLVYPDQYVSKIPNLSFEELVQSGNVKPFRFPEFDYIKQLDRCLISSQPVWRGSLHFNDNIWFDEKYEVCGDYDFCMKISQKYNLLHINQYLGVFYLSDTNQNKSYKESGTGRFEMSEISTPNIKEFIRTSSIEELNNINANFRMYTSLPLPLFYVYKKVSIMLKPSNIIESLFYTIEFVYYWTILYLQRENRTKEAIRLSRRFLRYIKSKRIIDNLNNLTAE